MKKELVRKCFCNVRGDEFYKDLIEEAVQEFINKLDAYFSNGYLTSIKIHAFVKDRYVEKEGVDE